MSTNLLDRLRVKNTPITQTRPKFFLKARRSLADKPVPHVESDATVTEDEDEDEYVEKTFTKPKLIVDKRMSRAVDRAAFLKDLSDSKKERVVSRPEPLPKVETDPEPIPKVESKTKTKTKTKTKSIPKPYMAAEEPDEDKKSKTYMSREEIAALPDGSKFKIKVIRKGNPLVVKNTTTGLVNIGDADMNTRFGPKKPSVLIKSSSYYNDNREIFINFINSLFSPYKDELKLDATTASCDSRSGDSISLMAHQKIIRDYINLHTPYRGLLLYHGLGSGKTCASISIAEGMKDNRKIIVMTPASLKKNYYEELKKCGDSMYKKNQFWEFVKPTPENIEALSAFLNLEQSYIKAKSGVWLVNSKKAPNYDAISGTDKQSLDKQIDDMIERKYRFISYNGLLKSHMNALTTENGKKVNPFDNSVVIIDEAHNMVSRIVNKISRKSSDSVSILLYELLMTADNVRIILLSGTPVINYPNEIAILFNILRGYIKTWHLTLNIPSVGRDPTRITTEYFEDVFKNTTKGGNVADYIKYDARSSTLTITRNPFGFVNQTKRGKYDGVRAANGGNMTDEEFMFNINRLLNGEKIKITKTSVEMYKALPDKMDDFKNKFINSENSVQNMDLLKRRILGLTSYFRSAQESLMPKFIMSSNFHTVNVEMSDFQFKIYEAQRVIERKQAVNSKKKRGNPDPNVFEDSVSTYRIFSRSFCNFVFPPGMTRPLPDKTTETEEVDEDAIDPIAKLDNADGKYEADELVAAEASVDYDYNSKVKAALTELNDKKLELLTNEQLESSSPKFKKMVDTINHPDNVGLHLVYSQFRTLEGIGIFKLVLEAHGFTEFLISNSSGEWRLAVPQEERGKPMFVLYTGTESQAQKEIFRNVFNNDWKYIPASLRRDITSISDSNLYGDIIKVFMITASGAEGISLKNTRYVHLMEPYWHPVRVRQVIGRARRICSHQDLPEHLRTVDVFLYLMNFSESQLEGATLELLTKDVSKLDSSKPFTSDQTLWEIANIKEDVIKNLLDAVKESAIDCSIHSNSGSEKLKCFSFGSDVNPNKFSYTRSFDDEPNDAVAKQNKRNVIINPVEIIFNGKKYAYVEETGIVYDYDNYKEGNAVYAGKLVKTETGYKLVGISNFEE